MQDASRRAKTVDADGPVMIAKPWMYFSKFGSPHLTSVRIAALLAGIILATGCGDSSQDEDFSGETGPITYRERDPILIALQSAGNWELAPVQATLHDPNDEWNDEWGLTSEQAAALAEADMTWYSADGTRYEALFVTDTGVTYGRRGAAPHANPPTEADSYGASADHPPPDDEMGEDDEPEDETEPLKTEQKIVPETTTREGIATPCNTDNRARISNSSTLTSMPSQMIGAMSGSGNTKSGSCSASKIGPRAALTASHCVMNASGVINTTGFLNPGQSNTSALNGSIARVGGVFLRDHRIHTRADYAVFFLQDSQAVFNLGWLASCGVILQAHTRESQPRFVDIRVDPTTLAGPWPNNVASPRPSPMINATAGCTPTPRRWAATRTRRSRRSGRSSISPWV